MRRLINRVRRTQRSGERGAVLVIVAAGLVAFMGFAAFAVDLGWIYLQSSNVKKAAEAAALAAVVHMPLATPQIAGTEIMPGAAASDAADAISVEHGYAANSTKVSRWAKSTQVRVDVTSSTDTFFMSFFGIDTIQLNRHAIAEQLPPLKLGSDGDRLGTYYDDSGNLIEDLNYWLGVNGERRRKQDGDPFSTRCEGSSGCGGTQNPLHKVPSYFYAVDIPAGDVGSPIVVWVYDGSNDSGGFDYTDDLSSGGSDEFTFALIEPDSTPGDPSDNRSNAGGAICTKTFANDDGNDVWESVCSFTPTKQGIHVLELIVDGGDDAINGYGLRVSGGSGGASVYGLGFMSLWMRDAGTSPTLQIVRLDEVYAGSQLIISAFDLGDINGAALANVTFGGSLGSVDCEVRTLNHDLLSPSSWGADDSAGAPCRLTTKSGNTGGNQGIYNNQWVEFLFDIPPGYTCSGSGCWATVTYNFNGGSPTDRTTWGARLNGTPIHLLNESTPSS
ncbi:MAG: pilus assembly protein TadG-related protein [Actinomycetia bacterium]|nr:pilus assembly protein TadG-related protein [Actinomycetes bacterium]